MADPQYNFDGIADVKPSYQGRNVLAEGRASLAQQQQGNAPDSPLIAALGPLAHPETVTDFARLLTLPVDTVRKAIGTVAAMAGARDLKASSAAAVRDVSSRAASGAIKGTAAVGDVVSPDVIGTISPRAGRAVETAQRLRSAMAERAAPPTAVAEPTAAPAAAGLNAYDLQLLQSRGLTAEQAAEKLAANPGQSAQAILSQEGLAARRAASQAQQAAARTATPTAVAAEPLKLSAIETGQVLKWRAQGIPDETILERLQTARQFNTQQGLSTPTKAQTRFPKGQRGGENPPSWER